MPKRASNSKVQFPNTETERDEGIIITILASQGEIYSKR